MRKHGYVLVASSNLNRWTKKHCQGTSVCSRCVGNKTTGWKCHRWELSFLIVFSFFRFSLFLFLLVSKTTSISSLPFFCFDFVVVHFRSSNHAIFCAIYTEWLTSTWQFASSKTAWIFKLRRPQTLYSQPPPPPPLPHSPKFLHKRAHSTKIWPHTAHEEMATPLSSSSCCWCCSYCCCFCCHCCCSGYFWCSRRCCCWYPHHCCCCCCCHCCCCCCLSHCCDYQSHHCCYCGCNCSFPAKAGTLDMSSGLKQMHNWHNMGTKHSNDITALNWHNMGTQHSTDITLGTKHSNDITALNWHHMGTQHSTDITWGQSTQLTSQRDKQVILLIVLLCNKGHSNRDLDRLQ